MFPSSGRKAPSLCRSQEAIGASSSLVCLIPPTLGQNHPLHLPLPQPLPHVGPAALTSAANCVTFPKKTGRDEGSPEVLGSPRAGPSLVDIGGTSEPSALGTLRWGGVAAGGRDAQWLTPVCCACLCRSPGGAALGVGTGESRAAASPGAQLHQSPPSLHPCCTHFRGSLWGWGGGLPVLPGVGSGPSPRSC